MKIRITTLVALLSYFPLLLWAQCISIQNGSWNSPSIWTNCDGGIPDENSEVIIYHTISYPSSFTLSPSGTLAIHAPGSLSFSSLFPPTFTNNGQVILNGGELSVPTLANNNSILLNNASSVSSTTLNNIGNISINDGSELKASLEMNSLGGTLSLDGGIVNAPGIFTMEAGTVTGQGIFNCGLSSVSISTVNDEFILLSTCTELNNLLPIELVTFDAKRKQGTVHIFWTTASETNNNAFVLERSPDGLNFMALHKQAGAGTSHEEHHYSFTDQAPLPGINYYRLRQRDFDGNTSVSPVIAVNHKTSTLKAKIFPNPLSSGNSLNIRLEVAVLQEEVQVFIFNSSGKRLFQKTYSPNNTPHLQIDLPSLKLDKGIYLLKIIHSSASFTERVLIY
ncbi:T9SS type A sorting domain-containing protein [Rapidithrix thailandica]|uniref:T9SS type A sorting domain-containing protein n=1 Tax=Rapidithrix thailandica TaxID=413964 RepID=A0AAW9RYR1_9BACT